MRRKKKIRNKLKGVLFEKKIVSKNFVSIPIKKNVEKSKNYSGKKNFIVSISKTCGNACLRNKLKRQIYNLIDIKDYSSEKGNLLWIRLKRKTKLLKNSSNKEFLMEIRNSILRITQKD